MERKKSVERKKCHQSRILYPAKWSYKGEGQVKIFSEKQKLRELIISNSRPALQELLKQILHRDGNDTCQKLDLHKERNTLTEINEGKIPL